MATRTLAALAATLLVISAAACGGGDDAPANDATTGADTTGTDTAGADPGATPGGDDGTGTGSDPGQVTPPRDNGGPPPGLQINPGVVQEDLDIQVGDDLRRFRLLVSADAAPAEGRPVLFFVHPPTTSHNPETASLYTELDALATDHGYAVVYPRGLYDGATYTWGTRAEKNDTFLRALHAAAAEKEAFDPARTFLMGQDGGATFVSNATATLDDLFAGFAIIGAAQQSPPNPATIDGARIYLGVGTGGGYHLKWALDFAESLVGAGWTMGQDLAVRIYPGDGPIGLREYMAALEWLDNDNLGGGSPVAPVLTAETIPDEAKGPLRKVLTIRPGADGTVWAMGTRGSLLQRAADGTWSAVEHALADHDLYDACASDAGPWVVGGRAGVQHFSADAWAKQTNLFLTNDWGNRTPNIPAVACSGDRVLLGANNDVAVTTDSGATWTTAGGFQPKQSNAEIRDVFFAGDGTVWLLLRDGGVYTSDNGGTQWNEAQPEFDTGLDYSNWLSFPTTDVYPVMHDMAMPAAGRIVAVGMRGTVRLRAADGSWETTSAGTDADLFDVYFSSADDGCVSGSDGTLLVTSDGGASWTSVTTGLEGQDLGGVYCDGTTVWVGADGGEIYSHTL